MRPVSRFLLAAILMAALPAVPAVAGEVADLATQAEAKAAAGDTAGALQLLREAMVKVNADAPLGFGRKLFVTEPPQGFGIFNPRPEGAFKAGEPLIAYVEPLGMGWKTEGDLNKSLMTVDFEIRDLEGKVLASQKEFGRFAFESRERNLEVMTQLRLDLTGAPAGKYVLGVTYNDQVTGKNASFDLPFEVQQ